MKLSHRHALFILLSLLLLLLSAGAIQRLIQLSLNFGNSEASHIPVIPCVSAALIWFHRKTIFRQVRWSIFGMIGIALGLVLWSADRSGGVRLNENDQVALLTFALIVSWIGARISSR